MLSVHSVTARASSDAPHHQHLFDAGGAAIGAQGLVDRWLERHGLVFAEAPIGRDHQLGLAVDQPVTQGIGRKSAKHHRVGCTDPGAGQHRDRRLWHHRHVERHQIALAHPEGLEGVGGFAHLGVQLPVGEGAGVAWFPFPNQGGFVGPGAVQVSVQAVETEVGAAAFKPAGHRGLAPVEHGVEGLEPVQLAAGQVAPEAVGIAFSAGAEVSIGLH